MAPLRDPSVGALGKRLQRIIERERRRTRLVDRVCFGRQIREQALHFSTSANARVEEALAEALKYWELSGLKGRSQLGYFYAVAGKRDEAQKILAEMQEMARQQYVPPGIFALIYAGLNDKDKAFMWLEKAYEQRGPGMIGLKTQPRGDSLRSDPRYADLMKRVGFAP